jgi:hypothetical protein
VIASSSLRLSQTVWSIASYVPARTPPQVG